MKILTNKNQQRLMALIYEVQKSITAENFCRATDFLCDIAGEVLSLCQLCALRDEICNIKEN